MRPIPAKDVQIDLAFPLGGLEVSCEFERQPAGTTPVGNNVRAFEALTERGRGGSRPGLTKFMLGMVGGTETVVVVDPPPPPPPPPPPEPPPDLGGDS